MKNTKKKNLSKGSVLIAVIGILAVLSIMALRFNAEMETAMIKTAGKNITSDVKVIADSGLKYAITQILANGASCNGAGGVNPTYDHPALKIEEDMEMTKIGTSGTMGSGIGYIPKYFNASYFFSGAKSTLATNYIPENLSLAPGNINFLVEDLSAKLPIGHVSQYFQRLLVSATLSKLLTNSVPLNFNAELFEDTNSTEVGGYDDASGSAVNLRSMVSYDIAKAAGTDRKDTAGLPLKDGILALEELGSSYSWINGSNKPSEKKHATDIARSASHYLLLSQALTPFSRFSFYQPDPDISYAQINPMVMSRQNERLYKSLFNFEPSDNRLKMYFSVSFPPDPLHGTLVKDDESSQKSALADPKYFETSIDDYMLTTGMPGLTISATSSTPSVPFTYNARGDAADTRPVISDAKFLSPGKASITPDKQKSWNDGEFSSAPTKANAYYLAMDKAVARLARAFKGTKIHSMPAENVMNPIMTRKTLELAIIKAVFGDSILFVIPDVSGAKKVFLNDFGANMGGAVANKPGEVDYLRMLKAIEANEIKLENIQFVENVFNSSNDDDMAKAYFVPAWKDYKNDVSGVKFDTTLTNNSASILVPAFGLYYDSANYINYLPHPYTDQRKLANTYVSVAAAYSDKHKASATIPGSNPYSVGNLYTGAAIGVKGCKMVATDANEAYADVSVSPSIVANGAPGADQVKLYYVNGTDVNFKPADFSPYETKIRMAVLVNLLNAIIPAKVTVTPNTANANVSFWGNAPLALATNLKDFIGCDANGVYSINGSPNYLSNWKGGVQTPGMTFWKFGVNSTTFQITVDAFKYEDSVRLSSVVTFDLFDGDGVKLGNKTSYDINPTLPTLNSAIYLNPLGRMESNREKYVIGNGKMRYPNVTDTDSWRVLSFVWSTPFARGVGSPEYFTPIFLYPESVVNIGADGGSWHFVPHTMEGGFTKFFYGSNNYYDSSIRLNLMTCTSLKDNSNDPDPLKGGPGTPRWRSYGKDSWLKWQTTFTKSMAANTLTLNFQRYGANANSGFTQNHRIDIIKRSTKVTVYSLSFGTTSNWSYQENFPFTINVPIDADDYDVMLTETNQSNDANGYGDERFVSISIFEK